MKNNFFTKQSCVIALLLHLCARGFTEDILLPTGSDPYTALSRLSADAGAVLPSVSLPYSRQHMRRCFETLESRAKEPIVAAEIASHAQALRRDDVPMLGFELDVQYEHFFRPDDQSLSFSSVQDASLEFACLLQKISPLASLRAWYQLDNSTILVMSAIEVREYRFGVQNDNLIPSTSWNPIASENQCIREGYLQSAFGPFEIVFGRQNVHIGPSPLSSLFISKRIPFLDALDIKFHLGHLTGTLLVSTLENRQALNDVSLAPVNPPGTYDFEKSVILYNVHYFEYDFGFARIGIGGQILLTRPQNAFQLGDFFPVISWHGTDLVPNNLCSLLDFSFVPFRGLTIYGQGGLDDFNLSVFGIGDSPIPHIPAFLFGMTWQDRVSSFEINSVLEAGYTHYLWGSFNDEAPLERALYRMDLDVAGLRWLPLTSPFGPGSVWVIAQGAVATPWRVEAGFRFQYVGKNSAASLTGPYEADSSVESAPIENWFQLGLEVAWTPIDPLRVKVLPQINWREGSAWMDLTIGGALRIDQDFRL